MASGQRTSSDSITESLLINCNLYPLSSSGGQVLKQNCQVNNFVTPFVCVCVLSSKKMRCLDT